MNTSHLSVAFSFVSPVGFFLRVVVLLSNLKPNQKPREAHKIWVTSIFLLSSEKSRVFLFFLFLSYQFTDNQKKKDSFFFPDLIFFILRCFTFFFRDSVQRDFFLGVYIDYRLVLVVEDIWR